MNDESIVDKKVNLLKQTCILYLHEDCKLPKHEAVRQCGKIAVMQKRVFTELISEILELVIRNSHGGGNWRRVIEQVKDATAA